MKWSYVPIADKPLLAVANASGELQLYDFEEGQTDLIVPSKVSRVSLGEECLALSLDWSNAKNQRYFKQYYPFFTYNSTLKRNLS